VGQRGRRTPEFRWVDWARGRRQVPNIPGRHCVLRALKPSLATISEEPRYQRAPLGDAGRAHIRDSLSRGLTLAREISNAVNLSDGQAFVYLPPSSRPHSRFHEGGVASALVSLSLLGEAVSQVMRVVRHSVLMAEDAMARCSDPGVRGEEGVLCCGEEVYRWVAQADAVPQAVIRAILTAESSWILNAFVFSLPQPDVAGRLLVSCTPRMLRSLAAGTRLIAVRAYDGEAYLIWTKGHGADLPRAFRGRIRSPDGDGIPLRLPITPLLLTSEWRCPNAPRCPEQRQGQRADQHARDNPRLQQLARRAA
jgi:hypothetical protein